MARNKIKAIAEWLVLIGAFVWLVIGVTGLFWDPINIVDRILGTVPMLENIVYTLVGGSGLYVLYKKLA